MVTESHDPEATSERVMTLVGEAARKLFHVWGFRPVLGDIWTRIFLSPEPISADELRADLGVSSGSLSMALKELVQLGLVYRETIEGERRHYYRAETDLWLVITSVFRERERERIAGIIGPIEEARRFLEEDEQSLSDSDVSYRLERIQSLSGVANFVLGLLDAFMARTKMELKAAQKWLKVSDKLGGEPLSRLRRAINAGRAEKKRRT